MSDALRVSGLCVSYGRLRAVQDVSIHVDPGEVVALVGANGAGKSSTLAAVSGIVRPVAGEIRLGERSLVGLRPEQILREGVGLVPEGRRVLGSLSVAENLKLGMTITRKRPDASESLERVLDRFPILRQMYKRNAGALSGGQQQQLAIARALLARPKVLLLDEPSLGLAPVMVDVVFELLEELRAEGLTIVLVEQFAARAVELADRTYILRTGTVGRSGTREELRDIDFAQEYLEA